MEREVDYYYLKNEEGKPFGCVAICENEDGTINRGVSLCSVKDQFKKTCARGLAFKRMKDAMKRKKTEFFADYNGICKNGLTCPTDFKEVFNTKSAYSVTPTAKEYRILHKPEGF